MARFTAERLIYGKLSGRDREHTVVGHSAHWPDAGGVPKSVGSPGDSDLTGACSLDWHPCGTESLLALSWCEPGPRITGRDFYQIHHIVARPNEWAQVLPFLTSIVAQLREVPAFDRVNPALSPFIFDYPKLAKPSATQEAWFGKHWAIIAAMLTALLQAESVYVRGSRSLDENLRIVSALMHILPVHVRPNLTFSTDDYARRPYRRRITFSSNNQADVAIDWRPDLTGIRSQPEAHPLVARLGAILAEAGVMAVQAEMRRPEYRTLSIDDPNSADHVLQGRCLDWRGKE